MAEISTHLAGKLRSEGQKTSDYLQGLTDGDWSKNVYSDGEHWTVRQILAHFISAEAGNARLIENIIAGGEGSPIDFDIDLFNKRDLPRWEKGSAEELIGQFRQQRESTAQLVQRLSDAALNYPGRHPFLGITTVEEIIKLTVIHNQLHLRDIRRALAGSS